MSKNKKVKIVSINLYVSESVNSILVIFFILIRLFVYLPMIILGFIYTPIMYILGTKDPLDHHVKLFEKIIFNKKEEKTETELMFELDMLREENERKREEKSV